MAAGGAAQSILAVGGMFTGAAAIPATGGASIILVGVSGLVFLNGIDNVQAGVRQMWSGEQVQTATSSVVEDVTGSRFAGELADAGIGLIGPAGVAKGMKIADVHISAYKISRESVNTKLSDYLLNKSHPVGKSKAKWFEDALGFTMDNMPDFARQVVFNPKTAKATELTQYGQKYNQVIDIVGANGKVIKVNFVWIKNIEDNIVRLVTAIPTPR